MKCPKCGNKLKKVIYPKWSLLNKEQWGAIRAGDYYCDTCTGDRGKNGYRYYWENELPSTLRQLRKEGE